MNVAAALEVEPGGAWAAGDACRVGDKFFRERALSKASRAFDEKNSRVAIRGHELGERGADVIAVGDHPIIDRGQHRWPFGGGSVCGPSPANPAYDLGDVAGAEAPETLECGRNELAVAGLEHEGSNHACQIAFRLNAFTDDENLWDNAGRRVSRVAEVVTLKILPAGDDEDEVGVGGFVFAPDFPAFIGTSGVFLLEVLVEHDRNGLGFARILERIGKVADALGLFRGFVLVTEENRWHGQTGLFRYAAESKNLRG